MATKKEEGTADAPKAAKAGADAAAPKADKAKVEKAKGEGKRKKGGADIGFQVATAEDLKAPRKEPRLRVFYKKEIAPTLQKEFKLPNPMQVPRLKKIVLNMGLGEAVRDPKILESAVVELAKITGQKPVLTMAKKSIATYKLREGMPIGCTVTLRRERMWEFLDRLVNIALPRVRDFRGVPAKMDGRGNYSLGLKEQIIFTEIDYDRVDKMRGMNITFVTTAPNDEQCKALLAHLGMPFRK
ncbi:MAG: 50S ribosomal protein L5 [Deltaproteobacteria bacterium]|nr:50S ribosomal protein L5 [Deltaproteobacteria bacterium]